MFSEYYVTELVYSWLIDGNSWRLIKSLSFLPKLFEHHVTHDHERTEVHMTQQTTETHADIMGRNETLTSI